MKEIQKKIEKILGYKFKNPELLYEALIHPSYSNENKLKKDNQRLEFLGDSVLGLFMTEFLYQKYPDQNEGQLSKLKSILVSKQILADLSIKKELHQFIFLGTGEQKSGGRERSSNLADAFEALIGAIYLDGGMKPVIGFLKELYDNMNIEEDHLNYKSELQEYSQSVFGQIPQYSTLKEEGPEHDKFFTIEVAIGRKYKAQGQGKTKKHAEQQAGKKMLSMIKKEIEKGVQH